MDSPFPIFKFLCTGCPNNQSQVHVEKKVRKNEKCKALYIGKFKGTPKPKCT